MAKLISPQNYPFDLRTIPLIADLSETDYEHLLPGVKLWQFSKGEIVFRTDDEAKQFFMLCQGSMKIYDNNANGKEQILYIYHPGDFIGGLNVLKDHKYRYMGQVLEPSLVATMSKQVFDCYALANPKILKRILEKSYDRIRWAESLVHRLSSSNAEIKVAALLLQLERDLGKKTSEGILIELPINREEMGSYAGLTRETMTRKLQELKDAGIIVFKSPKLLYILDIEELKEMAFAERF